MASNDKDPRASDVNDQRQQIIDFATGIVSKAMTKQFGPLQGGWVAARVGMYGHVTDTEVLKMMHECYMGGAQHIFSTIMQELSAGDEVSPADEQLMQRVMDELDEWTQQMRIKYSIGASEDQACPSPEERPSDPPCTDQGPSK